MTEDRLDDLAEALVEEAKAAPRSPGRSVAALVRHRMSAETEETRLRLRRRALKLLAKSNGQAEPEPRDWLTLEEAARHLRTSKRALKRAFHSVAGRRAYGWPRWRGHRWWVARQVVDPSLAPAYFANLPDEEPWPPESLPKWVAVDGSRLAP